MRVLLVEDDELLGDGLRAGIEQSGWVVDWVVDADSAERAFALDSFDLSVLDLGLPGRSGMDLLRCLRQRGHLIPILILTARDGAGDRVDALDAGADDYVCKPFDLYEVRARLRALHRRAAGYASPVLRHGPVEIDVVRRTVQLAGEPVALTPKELAILQRLVENAGKTVPRQRLERSIWGWNDAMGSNALEVHIHHLRRKVPALTLKAIRGVGYRID